MKKQLLLIASIFIWHLTLPAQSIFSSNTFDVRAGDTVIAISFSDSVTTPGPAGANQSWDFSFLQEAGRDTSVIQLASSLPQSGFFPGADFAGGNIVPAGSNSGGGASASADFFFSAGTNGELLYWGASTEINANGNIIIQNAPYSDPEVIFSYPMMYQDSVSDDFAGAFDPGGGIVVNRTGSNYRIYDGYGTLIMPNGATFTDVIRIRLVQTYSDTSASSAFPINNQYQSENVYYIGRGNKLPYLQYNSLTTTVAPNAPITTHFLVAYPNSGAVGIKEELLSADEMRLSPNPNSGQTKLAINSRGGERLRVEIMDIQGKVIKTVFEGAALPSSSEISLDNSDLVDGFYLVKVELGEKLGLLKMQVQN